MQRRRVIIIAFVTLALLFSLQLLLHPSSNDNPKLMEAQSSKLVSNSTNGIPLVKSEEAITVEQDFNLTLVEPLYHPEYGAGKKRLDPRRRYMIINEHGRGLNNYILGIVRGVMFARRLGRIPLIRKTLMNEHLYPVEYYFTDIPDPANITRQVKSGNKKCLFYPQTRLIPQNMSNVYPISNGITPEEYKQRFTIMNYQRIYERKTAIEFIEDYIEELSPRRIPSIVAGTYIDWRDLTKVVHPYRGEKIVALHNAFYIGVRTDRSINSVHRYRSDFLAKMRSKLLEHFQVLPQTYIAVHMRLGDFLTRGYSKPHTVTMNRIAKSLEGIQERLAKDTKLIILTNDPNNKDIRQQIQLHQTKNHEWMLSTSDNICPLCQVFFDMMIAHFSQVFVKNPKSTLTTNVLESRHTDTSLDRTIPLIPLNHRELLNTTAFLQSFTNKLRTNSVAPKQMTPGTPEGLKLYRERLALIQRVRNANTRHNQP